MQTHFVRRPAGRNQKLATPLEGLVYQLTPDDRLVVLPQVVDAVREHCRRHPEDGSHPPKLVEATVETLAARGFLKEVHGSRLTRFLETF